MDSIDNNQLQNESLETKLNTFFSNIEFSDNQKTRIIECINKFNEQNNENTEEENTQTALRKLKRYLKKGDVESAISLFENELNINNDILK
jgi:lipoprotein NlpI